MNPLLQGLGRIFNPKKPLLRVLQFIIGVTLIVGLFLSLNIPKRAVNWVRYHTTFLVARPSQIKAVIQQLKSDPVLSLQSHSVISGSLRIDPDNPRYFTDDSGKAILLTGSHTWSDFQDNGGSDPPPAFDYYLFLDFLQAYNHNFFRLWVWEQSRWTAETSDNNYWFNPAPPYQRTGPGLALDGKPKFDLTKFDQAYFDRMRQRIVEAGSRGIYVSVMLFNGWSVDPKDPRYGGGKNNPWKGHPFNRENNINGIDGDPNGDNIGIETEELLVPAVTAIQEAYVAKVIDTVNDMDNVLYEICNECTSGSKAWQYHMIDFVHSYETSKPKQHPVGITSFGNDDALLNSNAEWVSIYNEASLLPHVARGTKVSLLDTDHICGVCGDRYWAWKAFMNGHNPIFMDGYDGAGYGVGGVGFDFNEPTVLSLRKNLGYIRSFANRIHLNSMQPHGELASSGYALANWTADNGEFLVYLPEGGSVTVDLSGTTETLRLEWFNPQNGQNIAVGTTTGGALQSFSAPFAGDAVLYIYTHHQS